MMRRSCLERSGTRFLGREAVVVGEILEDGARVRRFERERG